MTMNFKSAHDMQKVTKFKASSSVIIDHDFMFLSHQFVSTHDQIIAWSLNNLKCVV